MRRGGLSASSLEGASEGPRQSDAPVAALPPRARGLRGARPAASLPPTGRVLHGSPLAVAAAAGVAPGLGLEGGGASSHSGATARLLRSASAGAAARSGPRGGAVGSKQLEADPAVVIFLDVDGVLHSLYGSEFFREECMKAFCQIVLRSNATVVLSSTWRLKLQSTAALNDVLRKRGLAGIKDRTPDFGNRPREEEILEWLSRHPEVQHWIAIDDMDLAERGSPHFGVMRAHFVKTDPNVGLQRSVHVEKALRLLHNPRGEAILGPSSSATAAGVHSSLS